MLVNNKVKNFTVWFCLILYFLAGVVDIDDFILPSDPGYFFSSKIAIEQTYYKSQSNISTNKLISSPQAPYKILSDNTNCSECINNFPPLEVPGAYHQPIKKLIQHKIYSYVSYVFNQVSFNNYKPPNVFKLTYHTETNLTSLKTVILLT